jgi:TolB-like protein/tetratricopeptide (TPR) repeat protein/predicted Ser/Thr protein kinase
MIGESISHYKILEKIGEGGMGKVYLADDLELHRRVAIKFLPPEYASDADALARFKREAQAAASLDHPNIVTIHDVGAHDNRPYIVMAYIDGEPLSHLIAEGHLKLDRILDIAEGVCTALASAHAASIVHRDIKPDNIVIGPDGRPKILDFGLAKLRGVTGVTREATTIGTVRYMSPEQTRGEDVDERSDIYSLGAVIYEMIAGRPPVTGDHVASVLYNIANEEAQPLARYSSGVTDDLERIVAKAMAKKKEERYQSANDLLVDLHSLRARGTPHVRAASPMRRFRVPLIAVVAVLSLAGAWYIVRPSRREPVAADRKSIAVLPFKNMSADPENEYFSDGITEDIIAQLSKIADLRVVSRTSVMRYKNTDENLREIGAELGVATILEGSVRREEGKVRIVGQLIDARTDEHIWAGTYDRDLTEIFQIQSDVAERIAHALEATLTPEEVKRIQIVPTENMTAYDYYLRGRESYHRYTRGGNEEAIVFFKKALELDADYALAYAGLGDGYGQRAMRYGYGPAWADSSTKMSETAIALEPNLAEGYKALGMGYNYKGWFRKALDVDIKSTELDPNYVDAFGNVGWVYVQMGRPDEAFPWFRKALSKKPDGVLEAMGMASVYVSVWEYDVARRWVQRGLDLHPNDEMASHMLAGSFFLEGRLEEARKRVNAIIEANPDLWYERSLAIWIELEAGNIAGARDMLVVCSKKQWADPDAQSFIDTYLGCVLELLGDEEEAAPLLERATADLMKKIDAGDERSVLPERLTYIWAVRGNREEALEWLQRTFEAGNLSVQETQKNPFLANLQDDQRFEQMIADVQTRVESMRSRIETIEP